MKPDDGLPPTRAECERDELIVGRMRDVRNQEREAWIASMDPFDPANQHMIYYREAPDGR